MERMYVFTILSIILGLTADGVEGKIWQCLPPYDFGIIWKQGKKPGLPYHFTDINQLELL